MYLNVTQELFVRTLKVLKLVLTDIQWLIFAARVDFDVDSTEYNSSTQVLIRFPKGKRHRIKTSVCLHEMNITSQKKAHTQKSAQCNGPAAQCV